MTDSNDSLQLLGRAKVLIIEAHEAIGRVLVETLERSGMTTCWATSGEMGLALKGSFLPDVTLVDPVLHDMDGVRLVMALVRIGGGGIIIVSGEVSATDRIVGLELGADDYVSKSVNVRELLARIRAVYRRVRVHKIEDAKADSTDIIRVGKIQIDLARRQVYDADGSYIALKPAEYAVLEMVVIASGRTVSRDELSQGALGRMWCAADRGVDQLVFGLRTKLGEQNFVIQSVRGAGYGLSAFALSEAPALQRVQ